MLLQEDVDQLVEMGFTELRAQKALVKTDNGGLEVRVMLRRTVSLATHARTRPLPHRQLHPQHVQSARPKPVNSADLVRLSTETV